MEEKKNEIELQEHRAIISLPMNAIAVEVTCKLLDEKQDLYSVQKTMDTDEVWDAFRRAEEGYFWEDGESHASPICEDDGLALLYLPENAVFAHFECRCIDTKNGGHVKVDRSLGMIGIRKAFSYADDDYIDEDDTFVITDKGREWLEGCKQSSGAC